MNVLIAYATNAGGTYFASLAVQKLLKFKRHSVVCKEVEDMEYSELKKYDLLIFASPSWNYEGAEGELQTSFKKFVREYAGDFIKNKPCAVFGLGDSSYLYFCGAVDRLEKFVKENGGKLLSSSLRIDGYYKNESAHNEMLQGWIEKILNHYSILYPNP